MNQKIKTQTLKSLPTIKNILPQIKYGLVFIYINILIIVHTISSLQLSKFFTLSIIKSQNDKEIKRVHHYMFCGIFLIIWIILFFILLGVIVFVYTLYESAMFPEKNLSCVEYFYEFFTWIKSYFTPDFYVFYIAFSLILLLNIILMIYYIETRQLNTMVYDTNPLPNEMNDEDDEDDIDEPDKEDIDNPLESDPSGLGFSYGMINLLSSINTILIRIGIFMVTLVHLG